MNTPNHDINDSELLINTFFDKKDGSVKRGYNVTPEQSPSFSKTKSPAISSFNASIEKLNLAKASSLTEGVATYQPAFRASNKRKTAKQTLIAIVTLGTVGLSIVGYGVNSLVHKIKNDISYNDIISSISYVRDNMIFSSDRNPNDQYRPYYDYDTNKILAALEQDTRFTPDEEIYATQQDSKGLYNADTKVMDPVVRMETGGEISTFNEYLESQGYSSDNVQQWEKDMAKNFYDNLDEYKGRLEENIEDVEVEHGRR